MKKRRKSIFKARANAGYLFIMPWLIGFCLLFAYPGIQSIIFSLHRLTVTADGYEMAWVGLANYIDALTVHPQYNRLLVEALVKMVRDVPLILVFSLFGAMLVNARFRGRMLARAIFFLPVILTSGIIMKMQSYDWMNDIMGEAMVEGTSASFGAVPFSLNQFFLDSGLHPTLVNYFASAVEQSHFIINASGIQILVFLAGLQSIPASLYEAAHMEGATGWEAFWKITFPLISPFILANMVYTVIDSFTYYNNSVLQMVSDTAFLSFNLGGSSAMAWLYLLAIMAVLLIVGGLLSRLTVYREEAR